MLKRILPYFVYLLVVAGLIVAIVFAFHHSSNNVAKTPKPSAVATQKQATAKPVPSTPATPSTPSQSAATSTSPTSGQQALSNTGPGDTVVVFAATVVSSALAYSLYQRKKLSA